MFRRPSKTDSSEVLFRSLTEWIFQLPHVSQAPHRLGGVEFQADGVEFVHFHGPSFLDIRLSVKDHERVLKEGKAEHHRAVNHHLGGWVSFRIKDDNDIDRAKELVELAYNNARGMKVHES